MKVDSMCDKIVSLLKKRRKDYFFRTLSSSAAAASINVLFVVYNAVLGIFYMRIWNISICVYYIFLAVIRTIIVNFMRKSDINSPEQKKKRRKIFIKTHILLLIMNLSMAAPIYAMVTGNRAYGFGLIPAISTAAYTTYRAAAAFVNFKRSRNSDNILVKEIYVINLADAMMAVLILQDTLITVGSTKQKNDDMTVFSAVTSGVILGFILIISIYSFIKGIKKYKLLQNNNEPC